MRVRHITRMESPTARNGSGPDPQMPLVQRLPGGNVVPAYQVSGWARGDSAAPNSSMAMRRMIRSGGDDLPLWYREDSKNRDRTACGTPHGVFY
jgi:hypothetical protein